MCIRDSYYIELLPIEGYKVPVSETRVHVKDKVEYLAIDDISLLIKTEDEVDAEAEDSAVADALADADKTEIQKLQTTSGNAKVGIDVSKWNKEIDWDKAVSYTHLMPVPGQWMDRYRSSSAWEHSWTASR